MIKIINENAQLESIKSVVFIPYLKQHISDLFFILFPKTDKNALKRE